MKPSDRLPTLTEQFAIQLAGCGLTNAEVAFAMNWTVDETGPFINRFQTAISRFKSGMHNAPASENLVGVVDNPVGYEPQPRGAYPH